MCWGFLGAVRRLFFASLLHALNTGRVFLVDMEGLRSRFKEEFKVEVVPGFVSGTWDRVLEDFLAGDVKATSIGEVIPLGFRVVRKFLGFLEVVSEVDLADLSGETFIAILEALNKVSQGSGRDLKALLMEVRVELYGRGKRVADASALIKGPEEYPPYNFLFVRKFDSLLLFVNMLSLVEEGYSRVAMLTPRMVEFVRVAQERYKFKRIGLVLAASLSSDVVTSVWWKFSGNSRFVNLLDKIHKTKRIIESFTNLKNVELLVESLSHDMEDYYPVFQEVAREWLERNMNFLYSELEYSSSSFEVFPYDAYWVYREDHPPVIVSFMTLSPIYYITG